MSTDADAARAAQHEDDARFWRERALRLGELARPGAFTIPDPRRPDARESSHPADADRRGPGPGPGPGPGSGPVPPGPSGTAAATLDALLATLPSYDARAPDPSSSRRPDVARRRANLHDVLADAHAVAADVSRRIDDVERELASLAERAANERAKFARALETRARAAAAPLESRRDALAALADDVDRSLAELVAAVAADAAAPPVSAADARRMREDADRARRDRDTIARELDAAIAGARETFDALPEVAETFERTFASAERVGREREAGTKSRSKSPSPRPPSQRPPWDSRTSIDAPPRWSPTVTQTRSADGVGAGGVSSESERWTSAEEEAIELEARAEEARDAATRARARARAAAPGGVPGHPGAIPPRTTFDPSGDAAGWSEWSAAAPWPDFRFAPEPRAYAGAFEAGRTPGAEQARVEALRDGYQRALLRTQNLRAVEREAAAAAAETAATELERQREQLATIAARLAAAAGAPSHPGFWHGSISKVADAAAAAAEARTAERPGPAVEEAADAARGVASRRRRRQERYHDREDETTRRFAEEGPGAGRSTDANAEGADVGVSRVKPPRAPPRSNASEAFADAASDAAEAFSRGEARARKVESMLARATDALEEEVRASAESFGDVLDRLRVARARADGEEDGEGVGEGDPGREILAEVLRRADRESRDDADAAAAAAAIRKSLDKETKSSEVVFGGNGGGGRPETARVPRVPPGRYARAAAAGYCAENERAGRGAAPTPSATSPRRAEPRPRRASRAPRPSANLRGSASVDGSDGGVYESMGPAAFTLDAFGTLTGR